MQIRAALLERSGAPRPYAASRPLRIGDFELAEPAAGEVRIAIRAAGLCHSDLAVIDGSRPRPLPMVLGHEAAGAVEAVGAGVTDLAPGAHVVAAFVPACGQCAPCRALRPALCEPGFAANSAGTLLRGARRLAERGTPLNHHLGVSAFATRATVARESLTAIEANVPFPVAALFGCAVITGVGAIVNTAAVPAGAGVAIVGLGGVGLAALLGARARGADPIVALDLDRGKLALALELGATHAVDAGSAGAPAEARALTAGGADFAFEMAGSARALELAFAITRRGGTTVAAGLAAPAARIELAPVQLVAEERTLKGCYLGSCVPARDIPRYLGWYRDGRLPVEKLLDRTLALEELNGAFDALAAGGVRRQILLPS
jgi:alcohol dehydrogenase